MLKERREKLYAGCTNIANPVVPVFADPQRERKQSIALTRQTRGSNVTTLLIKFKRKQVAQIKERMGNR